MSIKYLMCINAKNIDVARWPADARRWPADGPPMPADGPRKISKFLFFFVKQHNM